MKKKFIPIVIILLLFSLLVFGQDKDEWSIAPPIINKPTSTTTPTPEPMYIPNIEIKTMPKELKYKKMVIDLNENVIIEIKYNKMIIKLFDNTDIVEY